VKRATETKWIPVLPISATVGFSTPFTIAATSAALQM
jgi:hypothetical protein